MELSAILGAVLLIIVSWILFRKHRLYKKMAPGPYGLPIIGTLSHLLKYDPIDEFQKYKKRYGKVFSLSVGDFYVTVVTDPRLIVESLKKEEFQGRPEFRAWELRNQGKQNRGILFCDGPVWHEQRRFALRGLRDFGFGKESMEGMLIHELQELQNELRKDLGQPVSLNGVFNASVLNSLWYIITGNRFELSDPNLKTLTTLLIESLRNSPVTEPALFFFAPIKYNMRKVEPKKAEFRVKIKQFLDAVIDDHLKTYKEGEVRDFIDAYIQQIKESSSESSFHSEEGRFNLFAVLLDLFAAGAETTSTTLLWAMLFLSSHPEIQRKAQEEIDSIIGKSRPPSRADKPKLVYLEAVLSEVHRLASLVPFSVHHKASKDSEIGGYLVPKDSVILFSIYDAHHDDEVWGDAQNFRPERFLDETGTKAVKHEALIPFSSGKRQCLGETLARDSLFVFLAGLLQAFTFEFDPESKVNLRGSSSFISSPDPFKVIIRERK